jgi:hypothetical protein
VLRIIIEYGSFKGFLPQYQLGEMIHLNLVLKTFTFISFDILFSLSPPQMCTQAQLTLSPIGNHKTKFENIFFKNGYGTHHMQKLYIILSNCDNVIENIQIHMP